MEDSMSGSKHLRWTIAAAGVLTALTIGAAQAEQDVYFTDALRPNGQVRSTAAKFSDARACGASADHAIGFMPTFETCMNGKGWVLDHYGPDKAKSLAHGTVVNFIDSKGDGKGHGRGNAALQADGRACRSAGDQESAPFKACMAGRGWQFTVAQYGPPAAPQTRGSTWSDSSDSPMEEFDNHDGDPSQAAADAINAASQATADSLNAMNQQMQNDLIRANEPVQQQ
jgi:hypothetical protein